MRRTSLFLLILFIALVGCRNGNTPPSSQESGHIHEEGTIAFTAFSDSCEYFAEISPMIKGHPSEASVHITRLNNYKPLPEGRMSVRIVQNNIVVGSGDADKPRVPGIFPVQFTSSRSGPVSLKIIFDGNGLRDSVLVTDAVVYENEVEAEKETAHEEPSGVIAFTKEMAWKIDFHVLKVVPQNYYTTLKVSGELIIPPSEVTTLTAKSDGILLYRGANLVPGTLVERGTLLFTLTGQGLTTRNMDANVAAMKSRFEASKSAYEREKSLLKDQIVSQKQFSETVSRYKTDSIQYFTLLSGLSGDGMDITAVRGGFVMQLLQPNGSYVTEGTPLLSLAGNKTIMLRADVPQRNWKDIPLITTAAFRPSGSDQVYSIKEMGGRLVAKGTAMTAGNQYIPVTFEFPNSGSFIPGSFTEVFLHTTPLKDQLVIPVSSLLEEQGNFYVYVQTGGESFIKRTVKPGVMDGEFITVNSGLLPGDRVVTRGAIFIKASSQMSGTPSHGHEH